MINASGNAKVLKKESLEGATKNLTYKGNSIKPKNTKSSKNGGGSKSINPFTKYD